MRFPRLFSSDKQLASTPTPEPQATPKTYPRSSGDKRNVFSKRNRDTALLERLELFYNQGGVVAEAIDSYPLCILSSGYRLEGPEADVAKVQEVMDRIDFESICWQGIVESLKMGNAIQEIAKGRGQYANTILAIYPRAAKDFDIVYDEKGTITGYRQIISRDNFQTLSVELQPHEVVHLCLLPIAGSVYGASLLQRAYDDIERDAAIAEASAEAVKRHGFRRYHVRVGKEGETVPQEQIDAISNEFSKLSQNKTEVTTQHDVEIVGLDQGELTLTGYYEWATDRLCTSLGVPEEILGLGRGATEATATVRRKAWNDKIGAMQRKVERAYNLQLIDKITGVPGLVKLKFNDVDPEDESKKADFIAKLTANGVDPWAIITPEYARTYLGIEIEEEQPQAEPQPQATDANGSVQ